MSDLPDGWERTTIGDVADVQLGRQRSPKNHSGPHMRPYLRSANVTWDGIDVTDVKEMNFEPAEAATFELKPGDLLVNEASGSPNEVGKPAIWQGELDGCCFQNTLLRVRSKGPATEYLYWYCRSAALGGKFGEAGRGVNIRHLGKQGLASFALPLPPLAEQERIVAAIEEHLSHLDAASAALSKIAAKLRALRSAFLHDGFALDAPLRALGEVALVVSGQTPKGLEAAEPGCVPFFKVGDMNGADKGVLRQSRTMLSEYAITSLGIRLRPAGTVVFPKRGGAIATNKKRVLGSDAAFDLNTMGVVPGDALDGAYLRWWFETLDIGSLSDGSNVPQINHGDIAPLLIPVPGLDEQRRVVSDLDAAEVRTARLLEAVETTRTRASRLRRSTLAAAFSGELVPQDADDEPASVLLERIRAERAAATPTERTRRVKAS